MTKFLKALNVDSVLVTSLSFVIPLILLGVLGYCIHQQPQSTEELGFSVNIIRKKSCVLLLTLGLWLVN